MSLLAYFRSITGNLFQRSRMEREMDEELRSHMEHRADDLERSGVRLAEAERRARLEFGGQVRFKEECREALGGNFIAILAHDVRFSLRVLRKSPGFTLVALLTLALAIGSNAVVFGVFNGLILRPLNVPQGESLYGIERVNDKLPIQSYPDYLDLRDRNRSFDGLAAYDVTQAGLETGGTSAAVSLGVLGLMGAMLAVSGIFGMAAYSVSKRIKELGIRVALGAKRKDILQSALGRTFRLIGFGSVAGLLLGIAASKVLSAIVYQATPRDPLVLAGVVLAMALLGLLGTWIPAQRALSLDPLTLLREE